MPAGGRYRALLVLAGLLFRTPRRIAVEALAQPFPVHRAVFKLDKIDPVEGQREVVYRLAGVGAPLPAGGIHPEQLGKEALFAPRAGKGTHAVGEKAVHLRLLHDRVLVVALALNGPVLIVQGFRHEIDAEILSAQILTGGKFLPEPDRFEHVVTGIGAKPQLHQALEVASLLPLGKGDAPDLPQDVMDTVFRRLVRRDLRSIHGFFILSGPSPKHPCLGGRTFSVTSDAFSRFFGAFSQIEHINFIKFIFSLFNFSIKNGVFSRFLGTFSQIELVDFIKSYFSLFQCRPQLARLTYSRSFLSTCFMSSHTSFLPLGLRSR